MSIQVNITSAVKKKSIHNIDWFTNDTIDGGITGIDLVFQKTTPKKNHAIIEFDKCVQNISIDSILSLMIKKKMYELVPCDKLMKLFIPIILPLKYEKTGDVLSISKSLFEAAFKIAFQTDNIKFKCNYRRLDDDHVLLVTPYSVTWQMILSFWSILQDVLYATKVTKERTLYNKLFYYTVIDEFGREIDVSDESFKYLCVDASNKKIYFQRHTVFDSNFVKKFSKISNQNHYLKLPIYSKSITNVKSTDKEITLLTSPKIINEGLLMRDIINNVYRLQTDTQKILFSDFFAAVNQVLEKNKLKSMRNKWYNENMEKFLNTGILELKCGNYCCLTRSTNSKTHKNSTIKFEISIDGALYMKCSSCTERMLQIVWEKNETKSDVNSIKWNLFKKDYDFPDALIDNEKAIKDEITKYVNTTYGEKTDLMKETKLEYIEEELGKNDRGLANILHNIFDRRVKIINKGNDVFIWNGKMWEQDESKKFHKIVAIYSHYIIGSAIDPLEDSISSLYRDIVTAEITNNIDEAKRMKQQKTNLEGKKKKLESFRDRLDKGATKSVQDFLCPNLYDGEFQSKVNKHPYYFAAENGMVNLNTGCLEGFDPKFYLTDSCKHKYHSCSCPVGKCTMDKRCDSECDLSFIHNTVKQIMAYDDDLYDHLRWVIGYSLVGDPKKKKCLIGQGPKFNAKSLISNLICDVIPMYCKTMSKSVVIDYSKGSENGHSSHLTHLNGVRLAVLNETGQSERLNEEQVKGITGGGDKKNVREAHAAKAFDMDLGFVPFLFTNFAPKMSLNDEALWQRICPILFPVTFSLNPDPAKHPYENKMNEDLSNILRQNENMVKMFNWLIKCCSYYCQNQNKQYPDKILSIIQEYMDACNELSQFLDENSNRYAFDPKRIMPLDHLRSDFEQFCGKRYTVSRKQSILDHQYFNLMIKRMNLTIEVVPGKTEKMIRGLYCKSQFYNDDNENFEEEELRMI
jgi:phage/plasmid-associated DNA primase